MSGFEALGAAAAIAQFIEYGWKLTSQAIEIYRSADGSSKRIRELEEEAEHVKNLSDGLSTKFQQDSGVLGLGRAKAEMQLMLLARNCKETADDVLDTLKSFKVDTSAESHKGETKSNFVRRFGTLKFREGKHVAESVHAASLIERQRHRIQSHQRRIEELRKRLNEHLLDLISNRQCTLASSLNQIDQNNRRLESRVMSTLDKQREELMRAIQDNHIRSPGDHLAQTLKDIENEALLVTRRQSILLSLLSDEMYTRQEQIKNATDTTYEWIFDTESDGENPVMFSQWLENDNGIYWITGKAGSGKSTLMKYISTHPKTLEGLQKWANGRSLFTGTHYFWSTGTPWQRSQEGLIKSILYEVLRQCPELIDDVCIRPWENLGTYGRGHTISVTWHLSHLQESLGILGSKIFRHNGEDMLFSFFIDGLDEYEGDHEDIIKVLHRLSEAPHIKVCASSRPWEVFIDSFSVITESKYRLVLHQHTRKDIAKVVDDELSSRLSLAQRQDAGFTEIVEEIINKAEGVFLWVALVIKELIKGFRYADDLPKLKERLDKIPPGLTEYFEHLFRKLDTFYERETPRVFLTCLNAEVPLAANVLDVIIQDDPESYSIDASIDPQYSWNDPVLIERIRKQLNGRCQDLLELQPPADPLVAGSVHRIQFLHRTVREYLTQKDVLGGLSEQAGELFDPFVALCAAHLFIIKKGASTEDDPDSQHTFLGVNIDRNHEARAVICYARAVEHCSNRTALKMLKELDQAMSSLQTKPVLWPEVMAAASTADYREHAQIDFMACMIGSGLRWHVEHMIDSNNGILGQKEGRPYLDYALRNFEDRLQVFPLSHFDVDMVKLLLSQGTDPNEKVGIYDNRTVWELYLAHLYASIPKHQTSQNRSRQREAVWALIDHGADSVNLVRRFYGPVWAKFVEKFDGSVREKQSFTMFEVLTKVFGKIEASDMCDAIARKTSGTGTGTSGTARPASNSWAAYLKWW